MLVQYSDLILNFRQTASEYKDCSKSLQKTSLKLLTASVLKGQSDLYICWASYNKKIFLFLFYLINCKGIPALLLLQQKL